MRINLDKCDEIVNFALNMGLEVDAFQGVLLDNYIIHADKKIKIGNRTAKYIAILVKPLNEWSSELVVSFINCEKRINNIYKSLTME